MIASEINHSCLAQVFLINFKLNIMKKILSILAILILVSCNDEENATPTAPIDDPFDPMEMQVTLLKQVRLWV